MKPLPYCRIFLPVLLLLLTAWGYGQERSLLPVDPAIRQGKLANGLRYFIRQNGKPEDRAELRLVVRAGALQEDSDQLGVAHFVEHLAFNGSQHFAKNDLVHYLESIGSRFGPDLNAYTSFGETVYMLQARSDSLALLEKGLLILEDWAGGISFDSLEIEKERGVVIAEWRSRLSPDQRLQQQSFPVLYRNSRYAERLPIGDPDLIDTVSRATIRRFYTDWYRPDLMAIVAVGDFDPNWMEQEIVRRFSRLRGPENPRPHQQYGIPAQDSTFVVRFTDPELAFTRIEVHFKHPGQKRGYQRADFRQRLIESLHNRMLNARLFEYQQGQANPSFTFAYSGYGRDIADQDVYLVSAFTAAGKAAAGLEAVLTETYRALRHGFTPSELERQKADMLRGAEQAAKEQDKQQSAGLTSVLINHYLEGSPLMNDRQLFDLYGEMLPGIRLEDINPLPAQWLKSQNRVVVVSGPERADQALPGEKDLLGILEKAKDLSLDPYTDSSAGRPLIKEKPKGSLVASEKHYEKVGVTGWTLGNGIRIILKPTDFQNDQILVQAFSPGGHSLYGDADYQSASNAALLVALGGMGDFRLVELEKKKAGLDADVGPYIDELYEGFSGSCSNEDLEVLLQQIYLYATAPRKDSVALASFLSRQRSIVENMFINPYYYFAEAKNQLKYQDHPRRQMTKLEDLEKISLDRAFEVYQDRFADFSDFTFVFVGNFEVDSIKTLLQTYLGALPAAGRKENWRDVGARLYAGKLDTLITRGQAPKALVELVYHGSTGALSSQERYEFYSLMDLLRIKLRESMREDQGGVYGVRLSGILLREPAPGFQITLSFNAEPSQVDSLISLAKKVMQHLQENGPPESDLRKITETQRQDRIKALKENSFWLGQLSARFRENLPLDGILLDAYEPFLQNLSPDAISRSARRYLLGENEMQLVLVPITAD